MNWNENDGIFELLSAGTHHVMIREDSACDANWPDPVEIVEPEDLAIDYNLTSPSCENCTDGKITLNLKGGNPPYDVLWSNFETGKSRNNLSLGEYSVSITDSKFCKSLTTINLEMGFGSISIPNAFTPNGDGLNDKWVVKALEDYDLNEVIVSIFNMQGKLVYQNIPGNKVEWDGTSEGETLPRGTYYYLIKLNNLLDLVNGSITLIR